MGGEDQQEHLARRLLSAIARDDEASMEEFYGLFEKTVYAFAHSRLADPHAAADVVNEVMLVVWRTAGRFEGRSKIRTWLLGIAHNKVIDVLRKRGRYDAEALDEQIADTSADTGERVVAATQHGEKMARCLEKLSDRHRQVVHLAFFEDLSYPEIARIVDCPPGTVKTRMYHAKLSLKQCLERMGLSGEHVQ